MRALDTVVDLAAKKQPGASKFVVAGASQGDTSDTE